MTTATLTDLTPERATKAAKDAFYVSVGLGVLAARELNVRRLAIAARLEPAIADGKDQAVRVASQLDRGLSAVEDRVDVVLDQFQAALPEAARGPVQQARDAAKSARCQVRNLYVS